MSLKSIKTVELLIGYAVRFRRASPPVQTLYLCNAVSLIGGIIYGLYYGVFLYKSTVSLSVLAIDGLLAGFGLWVGYVIGVVLLKRRGYAVAYKTAYVIMAAVSFFTAAVANQITDWFMLLAVLRSLPAGIQAASFDTILVRDLNVKSRHSYLQIRMALDFTAAIIMPVLIGALISRAGGYQLAFILAGLVYLAATRIPIRLPRPDFNLNLKSVVTTFRRPLYKRHAANRTAAAGFNQMNAFVAMIIPFMMLKNELSVGLLTSAIAVVAAIVSLQVRKIKPNQKLRVGYIAYCIRCAASFSFVLIWTAPMMIIWQLINKLVTPLHDPLQQGLDIDNDSLIMGKDLQDQVLSINLLNNTLLFAGSSLAYFGFFFITKAAANQQGYVLQLLIVGFALWRFVNLSVTAWINRQAVSRLGAPQTATI